MRTRENITPSGDFASPAGVMPRYPGIRIIPRLTVGTTARPPAGPQDRERTDDALDDDAASARSAAYARRALHSAHALS
ncbi:hypothetical protein AB0L63_20760 [Nocardia sp. NPDC051990]|uniref:hypothetical protein n=1 Tax=Nocardia sp. NPDC051990 TaxID=3155285 RepID=UPI0034306969